MQTSPRGRFPNRARAFTLIEVMIALVVMLLTFLAMLAVVPFAFTNVQTNAIEVQAVAVGHGNFTVTPDGCATVEAPGDASDDFVGIYLCSVSVSWIQSSVTRTVTVQSYVTK